MEDLERVLQRLPHEAVKLIVVDGVFSMEGDLANLPAIVELKHKYNCSIMVDEAHGLGVFGRQGRGVCDHFGLTDEVDLIMGTFSKRFGFNLVVLLLVIRILLIISVIPAVHISFLQVMHLQQQLLLWKLSIL